MRMLQSQAPGGPDTLVMADAPAPQAGPGQILVRVAAVSINYPDALIIEDRYQVKPPRPFAPGSEMAGTVEAVGEGVSGFAPGDRVLAVTGFGALAELVAVDAAAAFAIPDSMDFATAATLLMTYGTVIYALEDRGKLAAGDTLLVLGAAGGIGMAAVELGKAIGARVVAAASTQDKADAAKAAGADEALVYPSGPLDKAASRALAEQFKGACGKDGATVVLDPVGGDYAEPALRTIGWEGRYLVVGFTAGIPTPPLNLTLLKSSAIVGVFWGAWTRKDPPAFRASVQRLFDHWSAGRIKPLISKRYPFEQAADAITHMASRQATGKLIVDLA